jgi:hypothetical protein
MLIRSIFDRFFASGRKDEVPLCEIIAAGHRHVIFDCADPSAFTSCCGDEAMNLTRIVWSLCAIVLLLVSPVLAQVKLEHKLVPGQSIKSKETVKSTQLLKIAEQAIDTKADTTMVTKMNVQDGGGGLLKVGFEFVSVASRVELPGNQVVEFDSTKPVAVEESDPLAKSVRDIFTSMIGSKVEATVAGGKVIVVEGVTEKMPVTADEMKVEIQQRLSLIPTTSLKPGDTWERTEELHIGAGQTLTFQRRYEYVGTTRFNPNDATSKEVDEVKASDLSVLYTVRQNPQLPLTVKKSDLKIDASEYTLVFDRKLGRIVKEAGKSHIVGDIDLAIGGQELSGSLDLLLESSSEEIE